MFLQTTINTEKLAKALHTTKDNYYPAIANVTDYVIDFSFQYEGKEFYIIGLMDKHTDASISKGDYLTPTMANEVIQEEITEINLWDDEGEIIPLSSDQELAIKTFILMQ